MKPKKSQFNPSKDGRNLLVMGKITEIDETPSEMIDRVVGAIYRKDMKYLEDVHSSANFINSLISFLDQKKIIFSTPILTNAGRKIEKPLSACTVPLDSMIEDIEELMVSLHQDGMGTGFNLDKFDDPVKILKILNNIAITSANSGLEDRPVGNMAILSVRHPKIKDFIYAKFGSDTEWKFNLSVNIDDEFMTLANKNKLLTLNDGAIVPAASLLDAISKAALITGDPGMIFMDRLNAKNPTPGLGHYESVSPCAEVGLSKGEVCHFAYINLGRLVDEKTKTIRYKQLKKASVILTRALDDCIDITIDNAKSSIDRKLLLQRRKIGIGICGLADALTLLELPYESKEARLLAKDIVQQIGYYSKQESHRLAKTRGSAKSFRDPDARNQYEASSNFLLGLAGVDMGSSSKSKKWIELSRNIQKTGLLRNTTTTALPPTGRSGRIIGASPGIEPHFDVKKVNFYVSRKIRNTSIEQRIAVNAQEIKPIDHIMMVAELQKVVDESISKTINLPKKTTKNMIKNIYNIACNNGLIGIAVYVDGSNMRQPVMLGGINGK